jgi:cell division protein FtsW
VIETGQRVEIDVCAHERASPSSDRSVSHNGDGQLIAGREEGTVQGNASAEKTIICTVLALVTLGVVMVYSCTLFAPHISDPVYKLRRQILWAVISVVSMILVYQTDFRQFTKRRNIIMALTGLLLLLVFVPGLGRTVNGAQRWIHVFNFTFQPSEFAKLGLVIFISSYISEKREEIRNFTGGFLPLAAAIAVVTILILAGRDIGTSFFVAVLGLSLVFMGGAKLSHIIAVTALSLLPLMAIAFYKFEYAKERIATFLSPAGDPLNAGYQIMQSLVALGSGGTFGVGLGSSRQKLFFLPERDTDFIFSVVGEELGFVGTSAVIILFIVILWQGFRIAKSANDTCAFLLACGVTLMVTAQALLNIAVVTATIPPKGIALPFISSGGSSLFISAVSMGFLLSVARHVRRESYCNVLSENAQCHE